MKTSMGSYFIKPTEHWREDDKDSLGSSLQHAIYRVPATASSNFNENTGFDVTEDEVRSRNCGVIGEATFTRTFTTNFIRAMFAPRRKDRHRQGVIGFARVDSSMQSSL